MKMVSEKKQIHFCSEILFCKDLGRLSLLMEKSVYVHWVGLKLVQRSLGPIYCPSLNFFLKAKFRHC